MVGRLLGVIVFFIWLGYVRFRDDFWGVVEVID
jgi:hypothetical protein